MPTNANAFNSRVTSELLEKKFRETFPSQGGAELVQDLYAQGVIVPVVDFTAAAEGTSLPQNLQTSWDFSTGTAQINSATPQNIVTTPGFWQIDLIYAGFVASAGAVATPADVDIYDGATAKPVWGFRPRTNAGSGVNEAVIENKFVVFLRAGDSLRGRAQNTDTRLTVWYRQIADVNGTLVNPLGYTPQ